MVTVGLAFDAMGNIVPTGRVRRALTADFIDATALPSWLTSDTGTVTFTSADSAIPQVRVATAASLNSTADLRLAFPLQYTRFQEIRWWLDGFRLQNDSLAGVEIQIASTSNGPSWQQATDAANSELSWKLSGVETVTDLPTVVLAGDNWQEAGRNLGMIWRPHDQVVFLVEGDQVLGVVEIADGPNFTPVFPRVRVTTGVTAAQEMWVQQIRLELFTN